MQANSVPWSGTMLACGVLSGSALLAYVPEKGCKAYMG